MRSRLLHLHNQKWQQYDFKFNMADQYARQLIEVKDHAKLSNPDINWFNIRDSNSLCLHFGHRFPFFFDSTQKELEEVVGERGSRAAEIQYSAAAIILYIIAIISAFVIKQKTKVVGITLLVIAVATLFLIGLFGAIGFALLLTSGIVALRYKMPSVQQD